ncbi:hypothetical protein ACFL2S_03485 [Thermodesulfobacteriota bacterium]
MKLSFDPYMVFKSSKTPAGLYARQKWLGESHDRRWKKDFDETVEKLIAEQANDGSWHQSEVETIGRLFGLHLTVRETSPRIDDGDVKCEYHKFFNTPFFACKLEMHL